MTPHAMRVSLRGTQHPMELQMEGEMRPPKGSSEPSRDEVAVVSGISA
jgi:hypothetical protein